MSKCTIGLLLSAAHIAYRIVGKDNSLRIEHRQGYVSTTQLKTDINSSGYCITAKTNADVKHSRGLTAVRLEPNDDESPVIISFRGTDSIRDMFSNMNLILTGTVGIELQAAAFDFYAETKKKFPNREIILVGHSLGGHLAQYVGAKAYAEDQDLRESRSLHVRTFNTAPLDSLHGRWLSDKHPSHFSQFCNYRLDRDVVSQTPVQQYYGNTFSFCTEKGRLAAHPLRAMRTVLPEAVKNLSVGGTSVDKRDLNTLKEAVIGIKEAYAAHIKGQWFSKFRMGSANKKIIDNALDLVTTELNKEPPDFETAKVQLRLAKLGAHGATSHNCLNCLINDIVYIQDKHKPLSKSLEAQPRTP
ncbi:lipase family protein [Legionella sp. WA2022007384]